MKQHDRGYNIFKEYTMHVKNIIVTEYSQYCHWRETLLIDRYCLPECLNRPCLESRLTISVSEDDGTLFSTEYFHSG